MPLPRLEACRDFHCLYHKAQTPNHSTRNHSCDIRDYPFLLISYCVLLASLAKLSRDPSYPMLQARETHLKPLEPKTEGVASDKGMKNTPFLVWVRSSTQARGSETLNKKVFIVTQCMASDFCLLNSVPFFSMSWQFLCSVQGRACPQSRALPKILSASEPITDCSVTVTCQAQLITWAKS